MSGAKRIVRSNWAMGEDDCVSYGEVMSCTEVPSRANFLTRDGVAISSLRPSLGLT